MLELSQFLETMDPDDRNVYASNIPDNYDYENRLGNLEQICLANLSPCMIMQGNLKKNV